MAKNKKKPSNRGTKANRKSLHCSSAVSKRTSKVKEWTKWILALTGFIKSITKGLVVVKSAYDQIKPWIKFIWEWVLN
jgi:hypothetical protein